MITQNNPSSQARSYREPLDRDNVSGAGARKSKFLRPEPRVETGIHTTS